MFFKCPELCPNKYSWTKYWDINNLWFLFSDKNHTLALVEHLCRKYDLLVVQMMQASDHFTRTAPFNNHHVLSSRSARLNEVFVFPQLVLVRWNSLPALRVLLEGTCVCLTCCRTVSAAKHVYTIKGCNREWCHKEGCNQMYKWNSVKKKKN